MTRALVPLLLALAACAQEAPRNEIVVALQDDARHLDPHRATAASTMRVLENVHETLVRPARELGEVEPALAASYEVSDDGLVYTFRLRPARFHGSGRPVTSADVKRSVERIRDLGVRAHHFADVEAIETPDERTVVFRLARPFAPFLACLAHPMNAVLDVDAEPRDAGCGPFRIAEWRRNRHVILERAADGPPLERIVLRPIPDETARTTALRTRDVHLILDVAAKDREILADAEGIVVASAPGTFWEYVGMRTDREPFDDVRVRQAVAWAVDRDRLNELVKLGHATPLRAGPIPEHHWAGCEEPVYPARDLERARALLAEAGLEEGFSCVMKVGSPFPYQVAAAEVVKQQLREVGIDVELQSLEGGVFFADLAEGDFDMTLVGWVDEIDPDQWLYAKFHTDGAFNQQAYSNPEVDALLERGRRTPDRAERQRIYREAQRRIARDAPMVFLYVNEQVSAYLDGVVGYEVRATASTRALRVTRRRAPAE